MDRNDIIDAIGIALISWAILKIVDHLMADEQEPATRPPAKELNHKTLSSRLPAVDVEYENVWQTAQPNVYFVPLTEGEDVNIILT